jgi:chemotaxis protein MotA
MGSITEPPEVLGKLIGGALVGTFLGVWLSYGFVGPVARKAQQMYEDEDKFLHCIKSALLAHMNGSAPAVSIEFARKVLYAETRPSFYEVENAVADLPPVA